MIKHLDQPITRDIASAFAIDAVRESHVVSRHGFGHGPRSRARPEEPIRHLLAGSNFRKGAVFGVVEVESENFLTRRGGRGFGHGKMKRRREALQPPRGCRQFCRSENGLCHYL